MSTIETKHVLRSLFAVIVVACVHTAVGCASDEPKIDFGYHDASAGGYVGSGGTSYNTGGGGTTSSGGTTGTGGTTSTGGAAGSTGDGGACVPPATLLSTDAFKPCNIGPDCTDGVCVAISLMTAVANVSQSTLDLLADCSVPDGGQAEKCVPKMFVAYQNKFVPKTCTSVAGAEGRCMSQCIPLVEQQKTFLPQDVCSAGELCAPCYDPRTSASTGACDQGCDTGPTKPAVTFASCCSGNGSCVPTSVVPSQYVSLLGTDTCTGSGDLCAPTKFQDLTYVPPHCNSIGGLEGRCIPDCIPAVQKQASFLPKDSCATGELCAPCYDPINGSNTGACTVNGDKPTADAPVTFPTCCTDRGHCVPTTALSSQQQTLLGQDTCSSGNLCAPDIFADSQQTAQTCTALTTIGLSAEGRCIPDCVPAVSTGYQAQYLDQGSCSTGYKCAPCYDPISGALTGACSQNGDSPKQPATTFPTCCSAGNGTYLGICVSTSLVPANQLSQLGPDTCTGTGIVCAPKNLADPSVKPAKCTTMSPLNLEGRCVPGCLPAVQSFASNLRQETCATGELCAPCYNPIDGTDTGACTINGDTPTDPMRQFASCGNAQGLCVPSALVPSNLLSAVPPDTCSTGLLCAPTEKVKDINYKFPSCTGLGTGGCVPKYLALYAGGDPLAQAIAPTFATCSSLGVTGLPAGNDWVCAPCINPLTNQPTGACL